MPDNLRIAILYAPDQVLRDGWQNALNGAGWQCQTVDTLPELVSRLAETSAEFAFVDADAAGDTLPEVLDALGANHPSATTILISSEVTAGALQAWIHAGVRDVLVKPVAPARLVSVADHWAPRTPAAGRDDDEPDSCSRDVGGTLLSQAIHALIEVLEAKDAYSVGFARAVAVLSNRIARLMGLGEEDRQAVCLAALLHDVGRVALRDHVLSKTGPLTPDEVSHIRTHPVVSAQILGHLFGKSEILSAVRHHHEWYNGQGYPDKLSGTDIPIGARIIAAADAFVAMTQERPHRAARSPADALAEIRSRSGVQFCPDVAAALAEVVGDNASGAVAAAPGPGRRAASGTPARRPPDSPGRGRGGEAPRPEEADVAVSPDELARRVRNVAGLRALPTVVAEVMGAAGDEDMQLGDLAGKIQCDHALSTKVLAMANCALYGGRVKTESIERAVVKLGVDRIRQIVVGIGVVDQWRDWGPGARFDIAAFWRHSMAAALIARQAGAHKGSAFQEGAHTAAFLHDIGQLVLQEALGDLYTVIVKAAREHRIDLFTAEQQRLGTHHAEVMRSVGKQWGMPGQLIKAITRHHMSWDALQHLDEDVLSMIVCVRIGDTFANALVLDPDRPTAIEMIPATFLHFLGLNETALLDLVPQVADQVAILGKAYGLIAEGAATGTAADRRGAARQGTYFSEDASALDPVRIFLESRGAPVETASSFRPTGSDTDGPWSWVRVATPDFLQQVIAGIRQSGPVMASIREDLLLLLPAGAPDAAQRLLEREGIRFLVEPWSVQAMLHEFSRMTAAEPVASSRGDA